MEYFLGPIKKYVEFQGRAGRKEYWMFVLCYVIVSIIASIIDSIIGISLLSTVLALGLLLPSLALGARRLHDTGRSGWWQLIAIVPLIGAIILIIFFVQASHEENEYGPKPEPM